MRWLLALLSAPMLVIGALMLLYGLDLIQYRNLICFDICPEWGTGPSSYWATVGIATIVGSLLLGLAALIIAPRQRSTAVE